MHEDYGLSCGTASTGSGSTSASEFRTYWFADTKTYEAKIKDDTPLDLWDSSNDAYKVTGYLYGLS